MPTETIDTRTSRRRRATFAVAALTVLAAVIAALALGTEPTAADEHDPDPIEATPLTGLSSFTDDVAVQVRDKPDRRHTEVVNLRDASQIIMAEVTIQPGAKFPWHTHPGMAMVVIADGDPDLPFEYIYDNCDTYAYQVGEAFIDPGFDNVHMARNPSDEVTTAIVTFVGVTEPDPVYGLTVPIDPDDGAALDDKCGIER